MGLQATSSLDGERAQLERHEPADPADLFDDPARRHEADLEEARLDFTARGFAVTGEVGDLNAAYAVSDVLIREGQDAFDEIIISTLPLGISRWVHLDVPARVERATDRPVTHVVAVHATAS